VIVEASACATPVLAAAVDAIPELILDGVTGKLFPYGDSDAMLNAMRQLNRDRDYAKRLGVAARDRTLHYFNQETFLEKVRQLYLNLAHSAADAHPVGAGRSYKPTRFPSRA
jgi:glycosyltransferase involved in cell wall biosynthesis